MLDFQDLRIVSKREKTFNPNQDYDWGDLSSLFYDRKLKDSYFGENSDYEPMLNWDISRKALKEFIKELDKDAKEFDGEYDDYLESVYDMDVKTTAFIDDMKNIIKKSDQTSDTIIFKFGEY